MADLEPLKEQDVSYHGHRIVGVDSFYDHGFSSGQLKAQGGVRHFHFQHPIVDGDALGLTSAQFADVFRPFVQNRAFSVKLLFARLVHELQGQFPDRVLVAVFHHVFCLRLQR